MDLGLLHNALPPLVCLHLVLSACMTGAVWAMHTIHYPLMRRVPPERFAAFMEEHLSRFTRWLAPLMMVELATAINLSLYGGWAPVTNLCLLVCAWSITFYLRPVYQQLSEGHKPELVDRLLRMNRYRTLLWLVHLVIAAYIAANTFISV